MDSTATISPQTEPDEQLEIPNQNATQQAAQLRLQLTFLKRLARLAEIRTTVESRETDPRVQRLIDLSLYSTYWDCVQLGRRDEARMVLQLPAQDQDESNSGEPGEGSIGHESNLSRQAV